MSLKKLSTRFFTYLTSHKVPDVSVLRFILSTYFLRYSAKDLFEAFYTRMFAKRLLLNKSASSDMEKVMLLKLQRGIGHSHILVRVGDFIS